VNIKFTLGSAVLFTLLRYEIFDIQPPQRCCFLELDSIFPCASSLGHADSMALAAHGHGSQAGRLVAVAVVRAAAESGAVGEFVEPA
jgi:hypothetical protein